MYEQKRCPELRSLPSVIIPATLHQLTSCVRLADNCLYTLSKEIEIYVLKFVLHRSVHLLAAMIEVISMFSLARKAYQIIFLQKAHEDFPSSLFHFKTHARSQHFPLQDTCDIAVFSTSIHIRHRSLFHFKTHARSQHFPLQDTCDIAVFSTSKKRATSQAFRLQDTCDIAVFSTSKTHTTSPAFPLQDTCEFAVFSTSIHMRHHSLFHFKTHAKSQSLPFQDICGIAVLSTSRQMSRQ